MDVWRKSSLFIVHPLAVLAEQKMPSGEEAKRKISRGKLVYKLIHFHDYVQSGKVVFWPDIG